MRFDGVYFLNLEVRFSSNPRYIDGLCAIFLRLIAIGGFYLRLTGYFFINYTLQPIFMELQHLQCDLH